LSEIGPAAGSILLVPEGSTGDPYQILAEYVEQGEYALCFTADRPVKVAGEYGLKKAAFYQFSSKISYNTIDPGDLRGAWSHVSSSLRENARIAILINHLDIIAGKNSIHKVRSFLVRLADAVKVSGSALVLAYDEKKIAPDLLPFIHKLQTRKLSEIVAEKERREDGFKVLLEFNDLLSDALLEGDIYQAVVGHSARVLGAKYSALFLPEDDGRSLRVQAGFNLSWAQLSSTGRRRTTKAAEPGTDPVERAFSGKSIQMVPDVLELPEGEPLREEASREGYSSVAALPLVHRGEALGVLCFCFERPIEPDDERENLMAAISHQAAAALANARFHEQMVARNRQLSALLETSKGINADLSLKTVLNSIAAKSVELLGAMKSVVLLWNEEAQQLEIAAKKGLKGKEYDGLVISLGEGVSGKVAESGKPLIVNDYQSSTYRMERFTHTTAFIAAPILKGTELLGVIGVLSEEEGIRFDKGSLDLLTLFALHAAIAIGNARLHQETLSMSHDLGKRANELASLHQISRAASSSLDLDVLMEKSATEAAAVIGVDRVAIALLDDEKDVLVVQSIYAVNDDSRLKFWKGASLSLVDFPTGSKVLATSQPITINCEEIGSSSEVETAFYCSQNIRSILFVPLVSVAGNIGLISFATIDRMKEFDESSINFCMMVAGELSLAVQNARLHGETTAHLSRLNSLMRIIKSMDMAGDLEEVLTQSLKEVKRVFRSTGETIYLRDTESNALREFIGRGTAKKHERLCEGVDCMLLENGKISLFSQEPKAVNCPAFGDGNGDFICSALKSGDAVYGTLRVYSRNGHGFMNGDRQLLEAIGEQLAGHLERRRLLQQVTHMAITDPLTGLYNRREFLRRFDSALTAAERYRRPLSFMMMDLDNFKAYNDALGHQAGDALLKEVTALIRRYIREPDIFCRYGGDELCVILPETGRDEALAMAERIRKAMESHCFKGEDQERGKITLTLGIAEYPGHGKNRDELILRADNALYLAKRHGRNRVYDHREES